MWQAHFKMTVGPHMLPVIKGVNYLVFLASLCFTLRSEITVITEGQHFLLAFPENLPNDCQFILNLTSAAPSDASRKLIHANISVPALKVSQVLTLTTGASVGISLREIGLSPDATSNVSRNNIIYVDVTGGKLSLYGSIICDSETIAQRKFGEFLAIPVEFWGTKYVVMAPSNTPCGYTVTVLTSSFDTTIIVSLKIPTQGSRKKGYAHIDGKNVTDNMFLNLHPYTRTEIRTVNLDITGTILESDFPIGLLVGPNNEASLSAAFCNNQQGLFVEQLIPTYAWGKRYYLIDGGASPNVQYTYDIRVVTSTASTTVYYDYLTSFANHTLRFKNSMLLKSAGGIHDFSFKDGFGFEMVGSDFPVMVVVYTSPSKGGDGAMSQAVNARSFPERVVLRFSPKLGQRMYLFTDVACSADLDIQILNAFHVSISYTPLDYGILGTEFYITSSANGEQEFLTTLYASTSIEACDGISAFIMNDIRNGPDVLAACPVFWSVECSDGQYFDLDQKECVSIQTTTLGTTSSEIQLLTMLPSSNPENTIDEGTLIYSTSTTNIIETTLLNSETTTEAVGVALQTLFSGYYTETAVTSQGTTEINQVTETFVFSSYLTDSIPTKMASDITHSPTSATTYSVTTSATTYSFTTSATTYSVTSPHSGQALYIVNDTLRPVQSDGTKSGLTKDSTTPRSSGPFITSIETTLSSRNSAGDAADAEMTPMKYCPCVCQPRVNRNNLYDTLAADMLKVSAGNLSRHRRARLSAKDSRPLSVSFGVGGILVFVCAFLFVLLPSVVKRKQSDERKTFVKTSRK